jgi:hypothetical protein
VTGVPDDEARKAAQLRKERKSFTEIADRLGLSSPQEAKRAVKDGLGLFVQENIDAERARCARELEGLEAATAAEVPSLADVAVLASCFLRAYAASMTAEQLRARAAELEQEAVRHDEADDDGDT